MAYNMEPLILECVYPFPDAGIPCPACGRTQKRPSLFNCHAKKVHHTLNTETPTTCSGCQKHFPSYKAASAHYSRAHIASKKTRKSPPANSQTTSPSSSLPSRGGDPLSPASTPVPDPPSYTMPAPVHPSPVQSLRLHSRSPPSSPPELLSPTVSTQEIMRNFLKDLPPPSPPQVIADSSSACITTSGASTTSSPDRPPTDPAPPIPIHSRRTIVPQSPTSIDDFIQSIRHTTRQPASSPSMCSPSPTNSPPPAPAPEPSIAARELEDNLATLRACLLDEPTSPLPPAPVSPQDDSRSQPPPPASPSQPSSPNAAPPLETAPTRPLPPSRDATAAPPDLDTSLDLPTTDDEQEQLKVFQDHWLHTFDLALSWADFSEQCELFADASRTLAISLSRPTAPRPQPTQVPVPRRTPQGRPTATYNPTEARRIQGLYRNSKKRAARKILSSNSTSYTGSREDAYHFFSSIFAAKPCNTDTLSKALRDTVPSAGPNNDHLYDEVTTQEVSAKLRSSANTAPGPDRVEYRHLKRVDPQTKILTRIFNRCLQQQDVPQQWKEALTVLIFKKGCPSDVSNFRPIALMSCIYKLFMAVLGKRLSAWAIGDDLLSNEQKSARPSEGCYEHTYLLQSLIGDARRNKRSIHVAWLDLRNAFGSVPHAAIKTTLLHMGAPEPLTNLIMNSYANSSTAVRTEQGNTDSIPIAAGVKQGCPMSPIIFNLCLELVLRAIKKKAATLRSGTVMHYNTQISVLAYADDLVVVARNKPTLQLLLDEASSHASILGLEFRPSKCATLSFLNEKNHPQRVEPHSFSVQGGQIPALEREESYRYLGIPIGMIHNINDLPSIVPQLIEDLHAIRESLLAPWQKLDAIRTFLQPALTYALRAGNPTKQSLEPYRKYLIQTLRVICDLPPKNSQSYFFASKHVGGLACQDPAKEDDVQAIVQAIRILSSSDPTVTSIARNELRSIVSRATSSNPTPALISQFLSGSTDDRCGNLHYTAGSTWTRCRNACRRLRVSFHYSVDDPVSVSTDDSAKIRSRMISTFLHRVVQQQAAKILMGLRDQGKVAKSLANDQYGNGSCWTHTGLNMRFKDWRFIHKARLNLLPTNAVKARYTNSTTSPTCRHCTEPETLPHILCHCRPEMVSIRARHNKVVDRLLHSIRFGQVTTDHAVPAANSRLRPDIIVEEGNRVLIIDVTCPFDNDTNAMEDAANAKISKYAPLKEHFTSNGKTCEVLPFVVGALGSWYPPNETVLQHLGMTRRYKSLFRKLCCTDVIQGSCDIFRLHMGWDKAV